MPQKVRILGLVRVYQMPVNGALCPTGEVINGHESEVYLDLEPEEIVHWGEGKSAVVRSFIRNGRTLYLLVSEIDAVYSHKPVRTTGSRGKLVRTDMP
jgi:hypothetical protein